jgi:hypothetical protein
MSATGGGTINGVTIQASEEISDSEAVMYDAAQIAANPGRTVIAGSDEANVTYDSITVNLWQSNLLAARVERTLGVEKLGSAAAAMVNGIDYGTGS